MEYTKLSKAVRHQWATTNLLVLHKMYDRRYANTIPKINFEYRQ